MRRRSNEAHHTATHILQAGLRNMFGSQITQAGSLVDPQKLRFDFTHGTPLSEENIEELEIWINNIANMDCKVEINDDVPLDEARGKGALAMFGEKYEDTVRVVNIPDISMELCGGTHVETTGKLRPFKIISEALSNIERGIYVYHHSQKKILNFFTKNNLSFISDRV